MTILTVRHITTYQYKQPVSFGEHRMMLRPCETFESIFVVMWQIIQAG